MKKMTKKELAEFRSQAAFKAWETRRKNAKKAAKKK